MTENNAPVKNVPSLRDRLRSRTVGAAKIFKTFTFTVSDGLEVEIREPTVEQWSNIYDKSTIVVDNKDGTTATKVDFKAFLASVLIQCCFVPGTQEHVFEEGDRASFYNSPRSSVLRQIADKAAEAMNLTEAEVEKN